MKKTAAVLLLLLVVLVISGRPDMSAWRDITQWLESNSPLRSAEPAPEENNRLIYKWVDVGGVSHFSDRRPPAGQDVEVIATADYTVETISLEDESSPLVSGRTRDEKRRSKVKKSGRRQRKPSRQAGGRAEIFTSDHCVYCKQALTFLREHGIAFTEYNIDRSTAARERMRAAGGVQHVPFAVINGKKIRGFAEGAYRRALNLPERDKPKAQATRTSHPRARFRSSGRT